MALDPKTDLEGVFFQLEDRARAVAASLRAFAHSIENEPPTADALRGLSGVASDLADGILALHDACIDRMNV